MLNLNAMNTHLPYTSWTLQEIVEISGPIDGSRIDINQR